MVVAICYDILSGQKWLNWRSNLGYVIKIRINLFYNRHVTSRSHKTITNLRIKIILNMGCLEQQPSWLFDLPVSHVLYPKYGEITISPICWVGSHRCLVLCLSRYIIVLCWLANEWAMFFMRSQIGKKSILQKLQI